MEGFHSYIDKEKMQRDAVPALLPCAAFLTRLAEAAFDLAANSSRPKGQFT